jgi:hypothetical protein
MDKNQGNNQSKSGIVNPFSLYDFYGYIFPGSIFLGFIIYDEVIPDGSTSVPLFDKIHVLGQNEFTYASILLVILLIATYTVGHVIAMISSLIFDKLMVGGMFGYPIENWIAGGISAKHRFINTLGFILIHLYLFVIIIVAFISFINPSLSINQTFLKCSKFLNDNFWEMGVSDLNQTILFENVTLSLLWILLFLGILKILAKIFLSVKNKSEQRKKRFREDRDIGFIYTVLWIPELKKLFEFIQKSLLDRIIALVDWMAQTNGKPSDEMIGFLKKEMGQRYKVNFEKNESSDSYWLSYFETAFSSPRMISPLLNWLQLYGFMRNSAMAFYLLGMYYVQRTISSNLFDYHDLLMLSVCFFFGFILLVRYWALYKGYYSKNLVRLYYVTKNNSSAESIQVNSGYSSNYTVS